MDYTNMVQGMSDDTLEDLADAVARERNIRHKRNRLNMRLAELFRDAEEEDIKLLYRETVVASGTLKFY